jgi:hypothetical protein
MGGKSTYIRQVCRVPVPRRLCKVQIGPDRGNRSHGTSWFIRTLLDGPGTYLRLDLMSRGCRRQSAEGYLDLHG